ncbi:hypothetical protein BYT27DRAFT_7188242 [Phlegmacium glaucopus]|nr:hypothetical protein BYT27DRAFT_7188242 [Phlegmacium glaucopus]
MLRLSGPQSLTFSSADDDELAKLDITRIGLLQPKPDFEKALAATTSLFVPQAICEMYPCGKYLQKKVIRGALTNGRQWIFLILNINDNFVGA